MSNKLPVLGLLAPIAGAILVARPALAQSDPVVGWRTELVRDAYPGGGASAPDALWNASGRLYYTAADPTNGRELWTSSGTWGSTRLVNNVGPGIADGTSNTVLVGERNVFFAGNDGSTGRQLWTSNGSPGGTQLVRQLAGGIRDGTSNTLSFSEGKTYFFGNDGSTGTELWVSDGTFNGTHLTRDIYAGGDGAVNNLKTLGGQAWFFGNDGANGQQLWISDGSSAGTRKVFTVNPGIADGTSHTLVPTNQGAYFTATDGVNGPGLWFSDGTAAGTHMLHAGNVAFGDGSVRFVSGATTGIYFGTNDAASGGALWYTDGTVAGTHPIRTLNPSGSANVGFADGSVRNLGRNGDVFFSANDGTNGQELWYTDGTPGGTRLVKNIGPGITDGTSNTISFSERQAFFPANDGTNGTQLWVSDGTTAGTIMLRGIRSDGSSANPRSFADVNGTMYFTADDGYRGSELSRTVPVARSRILPLIEGSAVDTALVNPSGHGTEVRLASNRIGAPQSLTVTMGDGSVRTVSDEAQVAYTGAEPLLVEMVFDGTSNTVLFGEDNFRLGRYNPSTGTWALAVDGNLSPYRQFVSGAWDGTLTPGMYGLDLDHRTAWAVVDGSGTYAIIAVPEPATGATAAGLAAIALAVWRRPRPRSRRVS